MADAPNVTTAGAPSSDVSTASTATAPATGETSASTTAAPPSGGESSTAPLSGKGLSYDDAIKRFDEKLAKDAAAAAEKADTKGEPESELTTDGGAKKDAPAEEEKTEPEPEAKTETKDAPEETDEEKAPPKVREALKVLPDRKLAKQLAENYYIAEAYRKSGMHLGDIPKYLEYGTLEDLETMRQHSELLQGISGDFESGDVNGLARLNGVLRTHNPDAYRAWLTHASSELETVAPDAYNRIAGNTARNLLANLRHDAEVEGNDDHNVVAEYLEQYLGWKGKDGKPVPSPANNLSQEQQRALREAEEIRARDQQRTVEERQALHASFIEQSVEQVKAKVVSHITNLVDENADGYTDAAKAKLVRDIANYVYERAKNSPTAGPRVDEMIRANGGYTQENFNRVTEYLTKLSLGFVPYGAENAFKEVSDLVGKQRRDRDAKVNAVTAKKEVGSGGSVPPPQPPKLSGKGKSYDEVFGEFDQLVARK